MQDLGSVSYSAAIESAATDTAFPPSSPFAQRVDREAGAAGSTRPGARVVLGDGARGSGSSPTNNSPGAPDLRPLHAKGQLPEVATALYGPTSICGALCPARHAELDAGRLAARWWRSARTGPPRRGAQMLRIPAPQSAPHALSPSSGHKASAGPGVVEAGCKVAAGSRLKRSGMHWTVAGPTPSSRSAAARLSGRFDDFWGRRSAPGGGRLTSSHNLDVHPRGSSQRPFSVVCAILAREATAPARQSYPHSGAPRDDRAQETTAPARHACAGVTQVRLDTPAQRRWPRIAPAPGRRTCGRPPPGRSRHDDESEDSHQMDPGKNRAIQRSPLACRARNRRVALVKK